MSVTGQLIQIPQLLVEQAKSVPSVIELFREVASSYNPEAPKIRNLEGLSLERICLLHEILIDPEHAVERWTLSDFSELEFWKAQHSADYKLIKKDIGRIIEATRINQELWLNRSWDALSYIFTGHTSDEELPSLIDESADIPKIDLFWGGKEIVAKNGEIKICYLENIEVREIAQALSRMTEQKIRQRFEEGLSIQPSLYHFSWQEQNYARLFEMCISVKEFYADAANRRNAILLEIN